MRILPDAGNQLLFLGKSSFSLSFILDSIIINYNPNNLIRFHLSHLLLFYQLFIVGSFWPIQYSSCTH